MTMRQRLVFWIILAVALGLRLWMIFALGDKLMTVYDDKMYVQSAVRLLESGTFTFGSYIDQPTVFIPPLFPLVLTGLFAIFGSGEIGLTVARICVALMGVGSLALVVRLGGMLFGRMNLQSQGEWFGSRSVVDAGESGVGINAGLIAAGVLAVYPPYILANCALLTETMFTLFALWFFIRLFRAVESKQWRDFVIAGLLLGLATYARPTIALLPIAVGLYLWFRRDFRFKQAFLVGTVLVAMLFAVLSPWIVRNYVDFHLFIPLTKASGNPFLTGTYINHDVWANGHDEEFKDYPKGWKKVPGDLLATDDLLMAKGKQHLKEQFQQNPWAMVKWYTYGKFKAYWDGTFDWADLLKPWKGSLQILHRILLALSLVGLLWAFKRRETYAWMMALWMAYFTALHMVYVTSPRYALPLLPFVFLYGAYVFVRKNPSR
ncbi:glycosyltransferase family 39 protein [Tumebacillus sp. ITR2]|uniref:Glycosyltransferase family 39 protein n=1 Tax=Tumebacillus amylolyticus TaxID=2801339 RepID=A0ABS1JFC0_9BACL|nr:glycosyltransferase family 39 protein [Tumebacillus amylolyticus]MBL0388990.1 glycosyltransferase family 39 protein [Tumebacillus amylolyticus]